MMIRTSKYVGLAILLSTMTGCLWKGGWLATVGPDYLEKPMSTPSKWQVPDNIYDQPIAHQGKPSNLQTWWDRFNDPALSRLLAAAQQASPTIAAAKARIAQARSGFIAANASLFPNLDLTGEITESVTSIEGLNIDLGKPQKDLRIDVLQYKGGLQSSWEIDLFGGLARQQEASLNQIESQQAAWHDARVSVAAEVANAYLNYRYCQVQTELLEADSASRQESAKLVKIAGNAGFRSPADIALAEATADDGLANLLARKIQCDRSLKSLVEMSGLQEQDVRAFLKTTPDLAAKLPTPPPFHIAAVPTQALLQRPDLAAAERDMAQACANIGVERAKQFPKLTLTGNISRTLLNLDANIFSTVEATMQAGSIGPSLTLPLFDYGKRAASTELARIQYETSIINFKGKVRTAVREVEDALLRLDGVDRRLPLERKAAANYQMSYHAQQQLYRSGMGNLIDVESVRRHALSAEMTVDELEQERVSAWIALYRAVGGGWENSLRTAAEKSP